MRSKCGAPIFGTRRNPRGIDRENQKLKEAILNYEKAVIDLQPNPFHGSNQFSLQKQGAPAVSSSPPPPPGSAALANLGADFTQIGTITQTVASIANLIATLNPTFSTTGGSVSTDDATLRELLLPKLRRSYPHAKIVDYSQKFPPLFGSDNFKNNSLIRELDSVKTEVISPLNDTLSDLFELNSRSSFLISAVDALVASNANADPKKKLSDADLATLKFIRQQVAELSRAVSGLAAAVGSLETVAYGFYDSILGGSGSFGGQQSGNPQSQSDQGSSADGSSSPSASQTKSPADTAKNSTPKSSQAQQIPSIGTPVITQSGAAASGSPFSRYAYVAFILDSLTTGQDDAKYKNLYLVSVKAVLAQGTDTTVKRFYIESYNALSSVARIYLQATKLTSGECYFSDEKESRGYQLYFPSRIRFQAEPRNKIPKWPEPVLAPVINTDRYLYNPRH